MSLSRDGERDLRLWRKVSLTKQIRLAHREMITMQYDGPMAKSACNEQGPKCTHVKCATVMSINEQVGSAQSHQDE